MSNARTSSGDVLRLSQVRKSYGVGTAIETEILHGIDLTLRRAEFTALIGPSGSGKSTLLNVIGLLEAATSGSIAIDGEAVDYRNESALTQRRAQSLGFVFQFHHLLPAFTALENVLMPRLINGETVDAKTRSDGLALLSAVGLADAQNKKPGALSGGMQQRVAIARALSMKPALVLADEPTGNLDTHSSDAIFALLRDFNRRENTAFLIVTHDPRLAHRCDRIIELVDGQIASDRPNVAR